MDALLASIARKKALLDTLRPASSAALQHLQKSYDVELTYTSNAIEGNTLTLRETAEVIEHGITVGGKRLKDHLEAVDHYEAVLWMRQLASDPSPVGEAVIRDLHRRIVARSEPGIAGIYSPHRRRNDGSPVVFPNPLLIRFGYVPVAVRPEDRSVYLDAPEHASLADDLEPFQTFIHRRLDDTLTDYVDALAGC